MSDSTSRIIFRIKVDRLLQDKPKRYSEIIKSKTERYNEYLTKVGEPDLCDINIIIGFMIELDVQYVSVRDDNE